MANALKKAHPFSVAARNRELLSRPNVAEQGLSSALSIAEISADIFALLEGFALQGVRRFFHHRFWETESLEAAFSDRAEPGVKLENVAAHSWHVADATLLILDHFDWLDREHCLSLAILHDKLEMYTGDVNPVGRDGTGRKTHAFDQSARLLKDTRERSALMRYTSSLNTRSAQRQARLLAEIIDGASEEARFIKAIDKLQAFAFVHLKKRGNMLDSHIRFTIRYSAKAYEYFPHLKGHYDFLLALFMEEIAHRRGRDASQLERDIFSQLELQFSDGPDSEDRAVRAHGRR